jgi:hypothetical protein
MCGEHRLFFQRLELVHDIDVTLIGLILHGVGRTNVRNSFNDQRFCSSIVQSDRMATYLRSYLLPCVDKTST